MSLSRLGHRRVVCDQWYGWPGSHRPITLAQQQRLVHRTCTARAGPVLFAAAACRALKHQWVRCYVVQPAQGSSGLSSFVSRSVPFMRDRLIADPRYCFIVLAEVAIDSGCATVAEVPTLPNPTCAAPGRRRAAGGSVT